MTQQVEVTYLIHGTTHRDKVKCDDASITIKRNGTAVSYTNGVCALTGRRIKAGLYRYVQCVHRFYEEESDHGTKEERRELHTQLRAGQPQAG